MDKTTLRETMKAKELVGVAGDRLLGRTVWTEAIGYYPGGAARVVELAPDPEAPEILFSVEHPTWKHSGSSRMGVFAWEEVLLL
jgi:hypothetical protein